MTTRKCEGRAVQGRTCSSRGRCRRGRLGRARKQRRRRWARTGRAVRWPRHMPSRGSRWPRSWRRSAHIWRPRCVSGKPACLAACFKRAACAQPVMHARSTLPLPHPYPYPTHPSLAVRHRDRAGAHGVQQCDALANDPSGVHKRVSSRTCSAPFGP